MFVRATLSGPREAAHPKPVVKITDIIKSEILFISFLRYVSKNKKLGASTIYKKMKIKNPAMAGNFYCAWDSVPVGRLRSTKVIRPLAKS